MRSTGSTSPRVRPISAASSTRLSQAVGAGKMRVSGSASVRTRTKGRWNSTMLRAYEAPVYCMRLVGRL